MQESHSITNFNTSITSSNNDDLFDTNPDNAILVTGKSSRSNSLFYYSDMPRTIKTSHVNNSAITWDYKIFDESVKYSDAVSSDLSEKIYSLGGYFILCKTGLSLGHYTEPNAKASSWKTLCSTTRSERIRKDGVLIEHTGPHCITDQLIFSLDGGSERPNTPNPMFQDPNFKVFAQRNINNSKEERSCYDCISRGEHRLPKDDNNEMVNYCKPNYVDYFYVTHLAIQDKKASVETGRKTLKWVSIEEAEISCIEDNRRFNLKKGFFVAFDRWSSYFGRKSIGKNPKYDIDIIRPDYLPPGAITYKDYKLYLQSSQNFGKFCIGSKITNANTYPAFTQVYFAQLATKEGSITHVPVFYHDEDFMEQRGYSDLDVVKMAFVTANKMVGLQGIQPSEEDLADIPIIPSNPISSSHTPKQTPTITSTASNSPTPSTPSTSNVKSSIQNAFSKPPSSAKLDNMSDNKADSIPF